jgi:hypothetical protein
MYSQTDRALVIIRARFMLLMVKFWALANCKIIRRRGKKEREIHDECEEIEEGNEIVVFDVQLSVKEDFGDDQVNRKYSQALYHVNAFMNFCFYSKTSGGCLH